MKTEPQKQHQWLQRFVGDWTYEIDADMGPDQPRIKSTGSETVRSLGGLWVLCEGQGQMPDGGAATTLMTLGYDPRVGRFVGTWVGSMMTHLWIYAGALDASGKVLTLDSEGPSFAEGPDATTLAKYQDIIELRSDDHRVLRSRLQGADGTWREFMEANYRRSR